MAEIFLSLEKLAVQLGGLQVLDHLVLTIRRGEQWAITGPSGSGKSVLAQTLLGRHFYTGEIRHAKPARIAMVEQQHRFKGQSGAGELYYQQRFNASDAGRTMTVEQELAQYGGAAANGNSAFTEEWLDDLHIRPLLSRPLIQLSNGENKRVQLAIALLEAPDMLILDNPFLGLDTAGRTTLHHIIDALAAKGMQLILIAGAQDLPASITHVAKLDGGKWVFTGPKEQFHPVWGNGPDVQPDPAILAELKTLAPPPSEDFKMAVKMEDVNIYYGEKALLRNVRWEVKKGERWNVSGPNGAGKSTLLSLITADNPQAYANQIWLFDRRRGTGETIWEIKQKIGFVSPELHLYFDYSATCFEVVASGLFDTIGLFRRLTEQQETHVLLWMRLLGLDQQRSRRLTQLSTGQQRKVLLARALIKNPPLLILDEPCQGLDEEQIAWFRDLIDKLCQTFGTTLIYVSHYSPEIPGIVNRFLKLENGRIVS